MLLSPSLIQKQTFQPLSLPEVRNHIVLAPRQCHREPFGQWLANRSRLWAPATSTSTDIQQHKHLMAWQSPCTNHRSSS